MPIVSAPDQLNEEDLYVDLDAVLGYPLYLKCEGMNLAGSVKLKAASRMIDAVERRGVLGPDSVLIESSSGNLGVALSMIAANRNYRFVCVTDSRCNVATRRQMESLGADVRVVTTPSSGGGLLGARLDYVRRRCADDRRYMWLNQYANAHNWLAHYHSTAPEIASRFPSLRVLFVGAGTTGTLMGCARYFRRHDARVRVVAVDAEGSVIFGQRAGQRMILGPGSGMVPPLLQSSFVDDVIHVTEVDTIRSCRMLAAAGFLFGGSTGTVLAGAMRWLAEREQRSAVDPGGKAVAIAPDFGERYLDTVYQDDWVRCRYGEDTTGRTTGE